MWVCVWYVHVCGGECGGEGAGTRVWCAIQYPPLLSIVFGDKVSYWTWSLTYRRELPQSVVYLGRTPCVLEWAQQEFVQPLLWSPYHGYFTTVGSFVPYRNTCCCFDGLWILSLTKTYFVFNYVYRGGDMCIWWSYINSIVSISCKCELSRLLLVHIFFNSLNRS